MSKKKYICVYFSKAPKWREKGHTYWFVCKKCLSKIAKGELNWKPIE